jgi:Ca2+-binding EF-hand superfamily protein
MIASAAMMGTARAEDAPELPGPIDSLGDLQDTAKMLFKSADVNNDGLISQQEAVDAGNLMVGGFFFRADADGDGKVTKQEADQAREALFTQRPILRFIFQRADEAAAAQGTKDDIHQAAQKALAAVDSNSDGAIDAKELRQAVNTGVQSLFLTADTNGDGQLTPGELNQAVIEVGRAALQAGFRTADLDNDGAINRDEYNKAIVNPAGVVFRILDANNDGKLTPQELNSGMKIVVKELQNLQVPEARETIPEKAIKAIQNAPAGSPAAPAAAPAPAAAQPR